MRTRTKARIAVASTSALVTEAAARGIRPPFQLIGSSDVFPGWLVHVPEGGDALYADEFGDLWWAKPSGARVARVVRALWPEEAVSFASEIDDGVAAVLGG